MERAAAWFSKDLDSAKTELVVFWRKRILIDADFANRVFRRKLAPAESVDEDLTPIRSGSRPGEGLKIGRQVVRVV